TLTTQMKAVGEVMAMGRNFQESLQKAVRALEIDKYGLEPMFEGNAEELRKQVVEALATPTPERLWVLADGFRAGMTVDELFQLTKIDPWYLEIGRASCRERVGDSVGVAHVQG